MTTARTLSRPPRAAVAAGHRPARRRPLVVLALCWLVVLFDGMDVNVYGAVMPRMLADPGLGLTSATAGTVGSWTTFGMLIGALAAGNLTDWTGRRPMIVGGTLLFSAGSALCAAAHGVEAFGLGRFITGLGLGGVMPICLNVVMEFAPGARAALTAGALMTSYHVGGMLATVLSLTLAADSGWRSVFWAGVVPALVAVPLLLWLLPESPAVLLAKGRTAEARKLARRYGLRPPHATTAPAAGARARWNTALALLRGTGRKATPLLWAASFCGLLLVYGVNTWLPQLMRAAGYGPTSSVAFLLVINAGGIVGMLIAGAVATRFGAARVSAVWFLLTAAGALLLTQRLPLPVTYVIVAFTGIWLFSAQVMVYATVPALYPSAQVSAGLGWATGIGRLGAVVGPALGGAVVAHGAQQWAFVTFAAAGLIGALAIHLAGRTPCRSGI
ncbi:MULTISPECIES: MFS transporter [unclassified Streptomyces]|uniref:MFS transporter n=1 Tax=unclassified Streptomyces TaxID=2593676 RepID=UPI002E0EF052|nr:MULTISPECIES: MFS transporter [unclassified Streptomyces]WSR21594.1 MFS transporter [Streptomyces sp. NBC_01205]